MSGELAFGVAIGLVLFLAMVLSWLVWKEWRADKAKEQRAKETANVTKKQRDVANPDSVRDSVAIMRAWKK